VLGRAKPLGGGLSPSNKRKKKTKREKSENFGGGEERIAKVRSKGDEHILDGGNERELAIGQRRLRNFGDSTSATRNPQEIQYRRALRRYRERLSGEKGNREQGKGNVCSEGYKPFSYAEALIVSTQEGKSSLCGKRLKCKRH